MVRPVSELHSPDLASGRQPPHGPAISTPALIPPEAFPPLTVIPANTCAAFTFEGGTSRLAMFIVVQVFVMQGRGAAAAAAWCMGSVITLAGLALCLSTYKARYYEAFCRSMLRSCVLSCASLPALPQRLTTVAAPHRHHHHHHHYHHHLATATLIKSCTLDRLATRLHGGRCCSSVSSAPLPTSPTRQRVRPVTPAGQQGVSSLQEVCPPQGAGPCRSLVVVLEEAYAARVKWPCFDARWPSSGGRPSACTSSVECRGHGHAGGQVTAPGILGWCAAEVVHRTSTTTATSTQRGSADHVEWRQSVPPTLPPNPSLVNADPDLPCPGQVSLKLSVGECVPQGVTRKGLHILARYRRRARDGDKGRHSS
ncbi:hypothetical protein E2C01_008729 [Portunus trituberculatus]|uniref:Uncharacterized protein n=1 Tax=Portunus trituberculatus TaxID=210409 RepID=A0A5B7D1J5_PORTR|nr:hypothetical protein [Portunus trituberculatus]